MATQATGLEFKNVVFNAARDGKLRRLKVGDECQRKQGVEQEQEVPPKELGWKIDA